jgi:hypothetical protein
MCLHHKIACSVFFALVLSLSGCGDGSNLAEVTGAVSIDGRPVDKGSITFIPADGQGPTTGAEIVAGKYTSEAPLGMSKVEIRVPRVIGKKRLYETADSPVQDIMEEVLPEKYNEKTELRLDAKPGRNEQNWDLQTKSPAPS